MGEEHIDAVTIERLSRELRANMAAAICAMDIQRAEDCFFCAERAAQAVVLELKKLGRESSSQGVVARNNAELASCVVQVCANATAALRMLRDLGEALGKFSE